MSSRSPARRRGRPYRYPEDTSPISRVHGGVDFRAAWLLGSSRIHAVDPVMAHRDQFVAALRDRGITADQTRVSRWESGSQKVPDKVVVAYEQILGLTPGHLGSAIDGLRRSLEPESVPNDTVTSSPVHLHEHLDHLFEQVDEEDPHGSHWLELTSYLATHPQIYLRKKSWLQLTDCLIAELGRSAGAAYTRRFEALRTLVRHPGAQHHVVKAVGAFVTDPGAQVVMHPLTLLQEVTHPKAGELTVRLLTAGAPMLQQGAAWVTAAKICRGHYDDDSLRQIEAALIMLVATAPRHLPEIDVLDVAARLPEDAVKRILAALDDSPAKPRLELMLRTGEILPQDVTGHVSRKIGEAAQSATSAPYNVEPDLMLQRLVREALFHGHQERRHQAGVLLTVSPYRTGVAAACARAVETSDDAVALQAAMLLRYLATAREREALLVWAQDESRQQIRGHALVALGRLPHGVRPEEEHLVTERLNEATWRPTKRASLFALGMCGADVLKDLTRSDDEVVRRAAEWWAHSGPAIHEAATIPGQNGALPSESQHG